VAKASRFADDLKMPYEPVLKKFGGFKRFAAASGVSLNVINSVQDIL